MPRACTICSRPDRKVIDAMIANNIPYLKIAKKIDANQVTVNRHGRLHVHPVMDSIERQANAAVYARVMSYRDEVNLPGPEKCKHIENKLWGDYDAADKTTDRMAVIREIQKQQSEHSKLTGAYQDNRANTETVVEALKCFADWLADHPDADAESRSQWMKRFAKGAGVPVDEFTKRYEASEVSQSVQ